MPSSCNGGVAFWGGAGGNARCQYNDWGGSASSCNFGATTLRYLMGEGEGEGGGLVAEYYPDDLTEDFERLRSGAKSLHPTASSIDVDADA